MSIKKTYRYLKSMYDPENTFFKFSLTSNPTLLSTDFSLMTLFLCNISIDKKKDNLVKALLKTKTSSNSFIDPNYDDSIERYHKPDYIINQFTFFTLIALDQLGCRFDRLPFFDHYLNKNQLELWFHSLKWDQFWYESNKIMFWLYFYSYILNYGQEHDRQKAAECIDCAFKVLNERQDKNTGYWGTDLNDNNLVDGCFGAAHIYLFYDYFNREIQYPEKIIDNTLSLHSFNGLMLSQEGGACEDYDAVEIYLRVAKQSDYRKNEINDKLYRMKKTIIKNQDPSGGFPYRFTPRKLGFIKQKKTANYRYSSWELMETDIYQPDTWGTFFRLLSVAAIDSILADNPEKYNSYRLPGWGYITR